MKKSLAILLCLVLMVPFAAHAEEPVELTFWIRTGDAFVEAYVADYMEEHPNVKINVMQVGSGYGDLRTKFNLGITSRELPDLSIAGFSGMGSLYDAGEIIDVSKADKSGALSDIVETFSTRCLYKDAVIAVPYQVSAPVMYYNRTLLNKAGLEVPQTFTQLMETGEKLIEKDANGVTTVYGFNTASDVSWYLRPMLYNFGGSLFNAQGDVELNTQEARDMFAWWAEMVKRGILPANQHTTAQDDFCNGAVAFYFTSCASYAELQKAVGDKFDLGVAYFPGEKIQEVNQGGNGIVVFTHDEKKQEVALDLISYLLQPERMQTIVDKGFLPVTNAMLNGDYVKNKIAADENFKAIYDQVTRVAIFLQHPAATKASTELGNIASEIESNPDSDIGALLDESQAVVNEYMMSYQ